MDLPTSAYPFANFVGNNQCGNDSDRLSPCTSSLSTGSLVLNPGTLHQTEVCSIALPSSNTFVSGADGGVLTSNDPGNFTLNSKATTGSLSYDPFSASDGFIPAGYYWRHGNNSCTGGDGVQLVANDAVMNVKQSAPVMPSSCNESGMPNDWSSLVHERELRKQYFECQSGRFLHNANRETSTLFQTSGGFSGAPHSNALDFGGNLAQITNQMAASEIFMNSHMYGNFSKPLQMGFDQMCKQQRLPNRTHVPSDCGLSASRSLHPMIGFHGNFKGTNPHITQSKFASNPARFSNNLSFQSSEEAQFNQVRLRQDLEYQKQSVQSVESIMSSVTKFEGISHGVESNSGYMISDEMSLYMPMQGFSQRVNGQNTSFLPQPFLGGSADDYLSSSERATVSHDHNWTPYCSENKTRKLQDNEKRDLLLLYFHARHCPDQEGACLNNFCKLMKGIINHMPFCRNSCNTCVQLHALLIHHRHCQSSNCLVCAPVKKLLCKNPLIRFGVENFNFKSSNMSGDHDAGIPISNSLVPTSDTGTDLQPFKRLKMECTSFQNLPQMETSQASKPVNSYVYLSPSEQISGHSSKSLAMGSVEEIKPCDYSSQGSSTTVCEVKFEDSEITDGELPINSGSTMGSKLGENSLEEKHAAGCNSSSQDPKVCSIVEREVVPVTPPKVVTEGEKQNMQVDTCDNAELKEKCETTVISTDCAFRSKIRKPNVKGVSLVESFTAEQVIAHMRSLREWFGLSKAKKEKIQAAEHVGDKNSCQLCGMGDLLFEPPPIYCVKCFCRVRHNGAYHIMANSENMMNGAGPLYLCNQCFNGSHGDSITYIGGVLPKAKFEKKRNDIQILELWVQCDKCTAWQHQICALFNSKWNVGGQAEYTCPKCYLQEIEKGERTPLPHGMILGAQDLPRSKLSDHIEERLLYHLEQERRERAESLQKNMDEVPAAEDLFVRVVSSVDKNLEVKQLFREIFEKESYPAGFPYKSKAILLFQKIEGADICLFGMYVQEYGSECPYPNQRRISLSYLDSVKYFRPDIKAVTGEALRTFVYHEILIGYLDYCKKRGFTSCHIWSCPPSKQEDFILNCHPEIQKTPKPEKLREWYQAMIRKATKENIVVENTKLYDFFFMLTGECKAKFTAARLPYFDGDFWPGSVDDWLRDLQQVEAGKEPQKKRRMTITKRALKASRHGALTDGPSKDSLLMFKLADGIRPMKDDFIIIHLQHSCSHCCQMIVSGKRWVCNLCKNFQLCDKCYCAEERLDEKHKHPFNSTEKHSLYPLEVDGVPTDTGDKDDNVESEFFDSRLAFLNLCQGNHYQYDTLRRAKHSTMMILYHLHNPTAPAFVSSCFHCHCDMETGLGWHCETCPDYDVCNSCYQQKGGACHIHELVRQTSSNSHDILQNKVCRQRQAQQIQDLLDLLVHASRCCVTHCTYPSCRSVKALFHHGANCKIRSSGGCASCKKMWYILHLHARACKEGSECRVPRCRDLKDHLKKMESQSNFRRWVGAMERMRQLEGSAALGDSE